MANPIIPIATRSAGKIGISRKALIQIAISQIEETPGVELYYPPEKKPKKVKAKAETAKELPEAVTVSVRHDGTFEVRAKINVGANVNPAKVCLTLQEKIATAFYLATERKKVEVLLDIKGIARASR